MVPTETCDPMSGLGNRDLSHPAGCPQYVRNALPQKRTSPSLAPNSDIDFKSLLTFLSRNRTVFDAGPAATYACSGLCPSNFSSGLARAHVSVRRHGPAT